MLREDTVVDGRQRVCTGEAESKDTEVSLETSADGETAGSRIHARHVLRVVDVLQSQLAAIIPVTVVEMLTYQRVRLNGEVLVHLHQSQQLTSLHRSRHHTMN